MSVFHAEVFLYVEGELMSLGGGGGEVDKVHILCLCIWKHQ